MNPIERRSTLFARLQREGKVSIKDVAAELGVSTMTVRRDLRLLVDQGQALVSMGTAYVTDTERIAVPSATEALVDAQLPKKQAIGRAAAQLVEDGDTIAIDCGTTPLQVARQLGPLRLTIVTNSLPVAAVVGTNPAIKLIYAPGEYSPDSSGMVGPLTVDFFHTIKVDKAFLGAHGFDAEGGANEPVLGDATAKRAMLEAAQASYLLVDSSKYGNVHLMALSKLSDFSGVITDDEFPSGRRAELERACNEVIYA